MMDLTKIRVMDVAGSGSCPMTWFGTGGSAAREVVDLFVRESTFL
jgi:hypothetical protein